MIGIQHSHWQITHRPFSGSGSGKGPPGVVTETDRDGHSIPRPAPDSGRKRSDLTDRLRVLDIGDTILLGGNYANHASARASVYKRGKRLGFRLSCNWSVELDTYEITRLALKRPGCRGRGFSALTLRMMDMRIGDRITVEGGDYTSKAAARGSIYKRGRQLGIKLICNQNGCGQYTVTRRA